jgi:hypothetical protein
MLPEEEAMEDINRRSAMALGLTAAAVTPLFAFTGPALAAPPNYGPNDGQDIGHGLRMVEIGDVESQIDAYKSIKIVDIIYPVGAADGDDDPVMDMDMVCHIIAGEFKIEKPGLAPYVVKDGMLYTCGKGKKDKATNISNVQGIHRIAMLMPA